MKNNVLTKIANQANQKVLDLMEAEIDDQTIKDVMEGIINRIPNLRELHLDNNLIGDQGAKIIASFLKQLPSLTVLSIQFNDIGKDGARAIFIARRQALPELKVLLRGNKIKNMSEMAGIEKQAQEEAPLDDSSRSSFSAN